MTTVATVVLVPIRLGWAYRMLPIAAFVVLESFRQAQGFLFLPTVVCVDMANFKQISKPLRPPRVLTAYLVFIPIFLEHLPVFFVKQASTATMQVRQSVLIARQMMLLGHLLVHFVLRERITLLSRSF